MPIVVAIVDNWTKYIDISNRAMSEGRIRVTWPPVQPLLYSDGNSQVTNCVMQEIDLYANGNYYTGLPVFSNE